MCWISTAQLPGKLALFVTFIRFRPAFKIIRMMVNALNSGYEKRQPLFWKLCLYAHYKITPPYYRNQILKKRKEKNGSKQVGSVVDS